MKTKTTILVIAIVIVGLTYAVGSAHPTASFKHSHCCGPQPEDIRMYRVAVGENVVIIPEVEGPNGFIITHVRRSNSLVRVFQDTGEGPEEIIRYDGAESFSAMTGVPVVAGSIITVIGNGGGATATIIGYVY